MSDNDPNRVQPQAESALGMDRPHRPADDHEEVYFQGSPLLRGTVGRTVLLGLVGLGFIALAVAGWVLGWHWPIWAGIVLVLVGLFMLVLPYLLTKSIHYRITNYRIDFERGLLSKKIDTLELWHVDDISFHQSLLDRIMGVGTITIVSDDRSTPHLTLSGIPRPRPVFESLKQRIISVKRQRGVLKMNLG
jgi:membrane protein YdbS with pleckstrin-like domain